MTNKEKSEKIHKMFLDNYDSIRGKGFNDSTDIRDAHRLHTECMLKILFPDDEEKDKTHKAKDLANGLKNVAWNRSKCQCGSDEYTKEFEDARCGFGNVSKKGSTLSATYFLLCPNGHKYPVCFSYSNI